MSNKDVIQKVLHDINEQELNQEAEQSILRAIIPMKKMEHIETYMDTNEIVIRISFTQ